MLDATLSGIFLLFGTAIQIPVTAESTADYIRGADVVRAALLHNRCFAGKPPQSLEGF